MSSRAEKDWPKHFEPKPGAFYEELANVASWRSRCHFCCCPKWAHAGLSIEASVPVVVGACACGTCPIYVPRRVELEIKGRERDGSGTLRRLNARDSKRIPCEADRCRARALFCRRVEWDTGNQKGVSFFYYCAVHVTPPDAQIIARARKKTATA